jgi:hypothetical protein
MAASSEGASLDVPVWNRRESCVIDRGSAKGMAFSLFFARITSFF